MSVGGKKVAQAGRFVTGLVIKALSKALELMVSRFSKKNVELGYLGFARVRLIPLNRTCVDEYHFGPSDIYKTELGP